MGREPSTAGTAAADGHAPRWNAVLRALRDARGITQDGWAAWLGVSRKTIQRWERGEMVPDADAEQRLIEYCREKTLFQTFAYGPLAGLSLTPDLLRDLLAVARLTTRHEREQCPDDDERGSDDGHRPGEQPASPSTPLPAPLTSFVGREREIAALTRLLGETRLLTLTGVGGAGKTRLALELAHHLAATLPDGVRWGELAALTDPALVPAAVAGACGVQETAGRSSVDALIQHLRDDHALIVLDNCEHLSTACAALATTLLAACPHLRILTTSRRPLGMPGETVWRVPFLTLPDEEALPAAALSRSEAAQLFLARAQAANAAAALTRQNAAAVVTICRRLDGIPLAIELAAARTRALTFEQIATRLDDNFRLLGSNHATLPHQQTLHASIDWSYDLLNEAEQLLLRRLAIFAGGFTLEAVEAICAEDLTGGAVECLIGLVDKSLVMMEADRDRAARYRLLEPVRQYAAEKLAAIEEAAVLGAHHRDWFLFVAEGAAPGLHGPDQVVTLTRLETDHENLRAALRWTLEHGTAEVGLRLLVALSDLWLMRAHFAEGCRWAEAILAMPGRDRAGRRLLARSLNFGAILASRHGDSARARVLAEEALEVARSAEDTAIAGRVMNTLGIIARDQGDLAGATTWWEASLAIMEDLNERGGIATARTNLGIAARDRGDYPAAIAHWEIPLTLYRALDDAQGIGNTLHQLATVALEQDDFPRSTALAEEALARRREVGYHYGTTSTLALLGLLAALQGDERRANTWIDESIALARRTGHRQGLAQALRARGEVALHYGADRADAPYAESLALFEQLADSSGIADALLGLARVALATGDMERAAQLSEESLALYHRIGSRRGVAVARTSRAAIAAACGNSEQATTLYREAIVTFHDLNSRRGIATCFEGLAGMERAQPEHAARLLGLAAALRGSIGAPIPPAERPRVEQVIATLRALLGEAPFTAAWSAGQATPLATAIAETGAA